MDLLGDSELREEMAGGGSKGGLDFEPVPKACFDGQLRCGSPDEAAIRLGNRVGSLGLHSIHIWVTSPSVRMSFMDSQSLSQSPK